MTAARSEVLEQRFSVGTDAELSVSNVSGAVHVSADEGSEIVVKYRKSGSPRSMESTQVEVRQDGNRVSVQTRSGPAGIINFGRASSVDYEVTVPRDCRVRIHAVNADVEVVGSRSGASIQTVSGTVQISDVAGDIGVTTVSGDVRARDLSGTLLARTTSGDGQFLSSRFRRFSINTVSGDFILETPLISDEHSSAKTVSGDLELLIPPESGATIQLKSISGGVSCEIPAEIIKSGRRHWQGRVNGGGGSVDMNSVSGDLKIRGWQTSRHGKTTYAATGSKDDTGRTPATPIPPVPPVPPIAPAAHVDPVHAGSNATSEMEQESEQVADSEEIRDDRSEDTAVVLRALENGEMSVEEAMAKLK